MIMAKYKVVLYAVLLAVAAVAIWYFQNDAVIDEQYLSTDRYRQLQQQLDEERSRYRVANRDINEVFETLIFSEESRRLELPFRLDSLSLDQYMGDSTRLPVDSRRLDDYNGRADYYNPGLVSRDSIDIIFLIVEIPSVYRNIEVWMATHHDGALVDVEGVAQFKNTIADRIHSELLVDEEGIEVAVQRLRKYPFRQESEGRYRYRIDGEGKISEEEF